MNAELQVNSPRTPLAELVSRMPGCANLGYFLCVFRCIGLIGGLMLCAFPGAAWAIPLETSASTSSEEEDALSSDVQGALQAALDQAQVPTRAQLEEIYRACILSHGGLGILLEDLDGRVARAAKEEGQLGQVELNTRHVLGALRWRRGDLALALAAYRELVKHAPKDLDARYAVARLYDANGRTKEALEAFGELIPDLEAAPQREAELGQVRLRMALLSMADGNEESQSALADFARQPDQSPELRARAAVVLSLLGRPDDAIELFELPSDKKARPKGMLRVAEWAIRAENGPVGQAMAWDAVRSLSCLLYTSPSPRDATLSRMPSSA